MELKELINKRKSTRSYTGVPVDEETIQKIKDFIGTMTPLYPDIRTRGEIVGSEHVKCILPWSTPQTVAIFSEEADGALENVGFLYQQLDLYLQSLGLGSCWLGMGRLNPKDNESLKPRDGMSFVMMIAFGHAKGEVLRSGPTEFKRKVLEAISDQPDERLEPARLAPSSVNSQPWYFVHGGDALHAYCALSGLIKKTRPSDMNLIDMGIALAHLYLANPDTFRFFKAKKPADIKNYGYIGSFTI